MKYVKYDINTGKILGYYSKEIHDTIPENTIEITDEQWRNALKNSYNHIDITTKEMSKKDFRTSDEIKKIKLKKLKSERNKQVENIIVTLSSGEKLNGDELSQTRLNRAYTNLNDDEEIDWISADDNIVKLNKDKIREALRKSGTLQTEIFIAYKKQVDEILKENEWQN